MAPNPPAIAGIAIIVLAVWGALGGLGWWIAARRNARFSLPRDKEDETSQGLIGKRPNAVSPPRPTVVPKGEADSESDDGDTSTTHGGYENAQIVSYTPSHTLPPSPPSKTPTLPRLTIPVYPSPMALTFPPIASTSATAHVQPIPASATSSESEYSMASASTHAYRMLERKPSPAPPVPTTPHYHRQHQPELMQDLALSATQLTPYDVGGAEQAERLERMKSMANQRKIGALMKQRAAGNKTTLERNVSMSLVTPTSPTSATNRYTSTLRV